ncbi:hypothetical protein BDZ89DRAFT_1129855 [Hymenopellis radicata]|nr:hypothetical protein BDZ89DRAFT_1129855 [Hymenopellis radicata]
MVFGNIYRKFGALNAGPQYTVNSLTDHRTFYNLQAYAKHMFGLDWRYHHSLAMINRTAFLLNYLWDIVPGASAYADWMNGDLYIQTEETFGMCRFPESLRERLEMQSYPEQNTPFARSLPHFKANDEWLRSRQALAMPARPPTTSEARSYFFANIKIFSAQAAQDGKRKINFDQFTRQWNSTADGKTRFYITPELLMAYAKGWERTNNIRASQEIINDTLKDVSRSATAFIANNVPFPSISGPPSFPQPARGILDVAAFSKTMSGALDASASRGSVAWPTVERNMDDVRVDRETRGQTSQYSRDATSIGASSSNAAALSSNPNAAVASSSNAVATASSNAAVAPSSSAASSSTNTASFPGMVGRSRVLGAAMSPRFDEGSTITPDHDELELGGPASMIEELDDK